MPSEIRRLIFFNTELFDALNSYGLKKGYEFKGSKITNVKWAEISKYNIHKYIEFENKTISKNNAEKAKNYIIITFFDEKTFEHRHYKLPAYFITEALIEYSTNNNIPIPENSRKVLDVTEFNICLDIIIDDKKWQEIELSLADD